MRKPTRTKKAFWDFHYHSSSALPSARLVPQLWCARQQTIWFHCISARRHSHNLLGLVVRIRFNYQSFQAFCEPSGIETVEQVHRCLGHSTRSHWHLPPSAAWVDSCWCFSSDHNLGMAEFYCCGILADPSRIL